MKLKPGDKLVTIQSFRESGLIHYSAPVTGSFECDIAIGTVFAVVSEPREGYPGFYVMPVEAEEFERCHVPTAERKSKKYSGYSFVFMTSAIGKKYDLYHDDD
ncbi:MAG: hypothetical protein HC796_08985 [Synechococcaceae cyanobacterium RL_1_2]|nr:hypothetical protein [Synechococcaceae cyanobacterium RL_1_2]